MDEDIINDFADKIRRYPKDPVLNWVIEYFPEIIEILEKENKHEH